MYRVVNVKLGEPGCWEARSKKGSHRSCTLQMFLSTITFRRRHSYVRLLFIGSWILALEQQQLQLQLLLLSAVFVPAAQHDSTVDRGSVGTLQS